MGVCLEQKKKKNGWVCIFFSFGSRESKRGGGKKKGSKSVSPKKPQPKERGVIKELRSLKCPTREGGRKKGGGKMTRERGGQIYKITERKKTKTRQRGEYGGNVLKKKIQRKCRTPS